MFVSQIHPRVDERDLFDFFSLVGRVEDIKLIRDQRTGKSKGLCYVEFRERQSVTKALALTGQLLGGFPITVQIVQNRQSTTSTVSDSMRLHVSNLHPSVGESDLRPVFEAFGPVEGIELHKDPSTGHSRGSGFVQFKHSADANAALGALNGLEIAGRSIKLSATEQIVREKDVGELDDDGGGGLQLSAQGRAELMQKLQRGTNILSGGDASGARAGPSVIAAAANLAVPRIQATTCVVVKNMFDPKTETEPNWDQDIRDDVAEEVSKYGKLKHIFVDKDSAGYVFLRFTSVPEAEAVVKAMNGRWFASRQITAEFMPEATYTLRFPSS